MRILVVEDDLTSRMFLQELLSKHGNVHVAINGAEATEAVRISLENGKPYNLICLDIMMPEMNGQEALRHIRAMEEENGILSSKGAKIIMTTSMADLKNVTEAYKNLCDAYITKPVNGNKLLEEIRKFELVV